MCRVVAVDMRGYGDSEKPVGSTYYRLKYLVEDVKNLIEALGKIITTENILVYRV